MLTKIDEAERIFGLAKSLLAEHRRYSRIQERGSKLVYGKTKGPNSAPKLDVDLNHQAHQITKLEAALHAACVDCGIADIRERAHYAERIFHMSAWHKYPWMPVRPKALADSEAL